MSITIEYYNKNAQTFSDGTVNVDFKSTQEQFIRLLPEKATILDFGCGAGRDTKYFVDHGYIVEAVDGSEELCKIASKYTGIQVRKMLFQELDEDNKYDGIWACASILHLPKTKLIAVLINMNRALKENGIIYTSFKYGDYEGERKGRYFTDFTEDTFRKLLTDVPKIKIEKQWITGDVRPERGEEQWLNLILRK